MLLLEIDPAVEVFVDAPGDHALDGLDCFCERVVSFEGLLLVALLAHFHQLDRLQAVWVCVGTVVP